MAAATAIILTLIMCLLVLALTQPEWLISTINYQSPRVLYEIETSIPVMALTIDDGPDPVQTPKILDLLAEYDAHATFFLIASRIPGNENLVRRMLQEGHEIANHMTTDESSILLDEAEFEDRLLEAHRLLSEFDEVTWFRPGSGWYNAPMLRIVEKHGYRMALGSIYPYDPQIGSAWISANYVLWKARPGSIVVLHDHGKRGERTAVALETILPELERRGYEVVTLSTLDAFGKDS